MVNAAQLPVRMFDFARPGAEAAHPAGIPMVAIKIICGCGQKYAFNVYPLNGQMPAPIQCPVCGMDGTAVANEAIARALGAQPCLLRLNPCPPSIIRRQGRAKKAAGNGGITSWPDGAAHG